LALEYTPRVTIFIPVFNTEKYIGEAIESIIAQTYPDWELIIKDDCSTDNTYAVIESYAARDSRIKIFRNGKNLGMMGNWNAGVPLCKSEYWGKLDADDLWEPNMLEECVRILDSDKEIALVCSRYADIDESGSALKEKDPLPPFARNNKFSCVDLVKQGPGGMFRYNVLRQGIGLIRREIFDKLGYFTLLDSGDTEMWFRIGCQHYIYGIDKVLHRHRIWSESFMRINADKDDMKASLNFFQTRNAIFDYYFSQDKISKSELKQFKNETQFIFNSFLIYKSRTTFRYGEMLKLLFTNFRLDFKRALKENLHIDRLFKGIKKHE
jgi:glycosyltransferase involved in cell wall biosynthesis